MPRISRRVFLRNSLAACACTRRNQVLAASNRQYVCPPCGCAMDGQIFDSPGNCPACGMKLIPRAGALSAGLPEGIGSFAMPGGKGREDKRITVHFYKPRKFTRRSQILIVVPGSGRNGHDYRDAWINAAEAHNVLILSPSYVEADYDFAAYQMGGVVDQLTFPTPAGGRFDIVTLRDEDIRFELNPRSDEWLFNDFDRLFADVVAATDSQQSGYDLFGHSAGGQILHRLVLFQRQINARRIVACNSGFYTLPDFESPQPFGLNGTPVTEHDLAIAFQRELVIGLGADDSSSESGGIQLHTPRADAQGLNRLDRGRYFFETSRKRANAMSVPFNWRLQIVPSIGHDHAGMGNAFISYLYGR